MPGGFRAETDAPWLDGLGSQLHALAPLDPQGQLQCLTHWARARGVHTESGYALQFVASTGDHRDYEAHIFSTGEVPTRTEGTGARHDLYNALAWLRWPRSKARLNALHVQARASGVPDRGRGAERDAATLLDENGLVWVGEDIGLESALRDFDWPTLFAVRRHELTGSVRIAVLGHALLQKLEAPFKGITAHALVLRMPSNSPHEAVDGALAARLHPQGLTARSFCPLPVMGLPGWSAANEDPHFYDDPLVFRRGRMRDAEAIMNPTHRPADGPLPHFSRKTS